MVQPHNLESNIWKYTVSLVTNKRIFAAILGAYYLTVPDVTAQTIGFIVLVGNLAGFLFEIPSGYLSDKMGHKQTLVFAHFLMLVSSILFAIANNTVLLIIASVFFNTAGAFRSGTGSAFMHETLRALGRDHEYAKVTGKSSSIGFLIPIVLTAAVPFLVEISFKLPFIIAAGLDVIGLLVALTFVAPNVPPVEIEEIKATNFKQVLAEGRSLGYLKFSLFNALISGSLIAFSIFRAPYQIELGILVIWFGVLLGAGRLMASGLLFYSGKIKHWFTDIHAFNWFRIFLYTILIALVALSDNLWLVLGTFILINGFQWGLTQISQGFTMEIIKQSKFKATLLSITSQIDSLISGVGAFLIGALIVKTSYQIGFAVLAGVFFGLTVMLNLYIVKRSRL